MFDNLDKYRRSIPQNMPPINLTIRDCQPTYIMDRRVFFGTTGLQISLYNDTIWSHFTPDDHVKPVTGREFEFGLRYSLGIDLLLQFCTDPGNFDGGNTPTVIIGETHKSMHDYRKSLFGSLQEYSTAPIYSETDANVSKDEYSWALDLVQLNMAIEEAQRRLSEGTLTTNQFNEIKYFQRLNQARQLLPVENPGYHVELRGKLS